MTDTEQRVAIITGGSQGIGAGLVAAYRQHSGVPSVLAALTKGGLASATR